MPLKTGGVYFNRKNAYGGVPDSESLQPTEWTILMWIKSSLPVGVDIGYYPFLLSKGRSEPKGYWICVDRYTQVLRVGTGDGTNRTEVTGEVIDNEWHLVGGKS